MNISIRPYKNSDFEMISSWWKKSNEVGPIEGMMIEDGTFILELNKIPVLSLTMFLTQSKEVSYVESFIKNPEFKDSNLEEYGQILFNHCCDYTKDKGYKRIITFCAIPKLTEKYKRLGLTPTMNNLTSLVRVL